VVPHYYDVDSLDEYKRLVVLERRLGDTGNDLPVVVMGGHVLGGMKEISAGLEGLLVRYRTTGLPAVDVPSVAQAEAELRQPVAGPGRPIRAAYFEEAGCRQCARAERALELAKARFPLLEIRRFGTRTGSDRILLETLCERAGVERARRLLVPAVFIGSRSLIREEVTDEGLNRLCADAGGGASSSPWEVSDEERAAAGQRLWERARAVTLTAVLVGGLVDGVNPCAFATLVFLVCCLAGAGRSAATMLSMGASFTLGVFAAYFVTGAGLSEALLRLDVLPLLSNVLTWIIIAATFAFAAASFWDFGLALRGRAEDMALKLPHRLRVRINAIVARRLHASSVVAGAFGLGAMVSLLEFVCTGQVYLPLIRYMTTVSGGRVRSLALLLLYNCAFVAPLVAVFLAAYFGLGSERLVAAFKRHLPVTKLLLAFLFLGLSGLLLGVQLGAVP
jgi:hypothetical protein